MSEAHLPLILPVGTRVVSRVARPASPSIAAFAVGAVGEIVEAPIDAQHRYGVRFVDGVEARLLRREFSILKVHKDLARAAPTAPLDELGLARFVMFRCVVGSRAYGLDTDASDWDRRGIYLPPAELHWSLAGVPEQLEDEATQECYWELRKFLELALKSNPNVLECLWSPLVEHATPLARELLELRGAFLSKLAYATYNGYVLSQFKKIEQGLRAGQELRWKPLMHLIRLLEAGIRIVRDGDVPVHVGERREALLAIKRGEVAFEEVNRRRLELHREFDAAFATTKLPERPDYALVDAYLIRARRAAVEFSP
ncbi:MAG: nucleotidyltransferase domain-containing protein [Planctomycetes bacterium]|nr:nucleotidyltransferase domain-containing protein [Planctomycetota bacterium]